MESKKIALAALGGTALIGAGFLASFGHGALLDGPGAAPARVTVTMVKAPSPTIVVPVGRGDTAVTVMAEGDAAHR